MADAGKTDKALIKRDEETSGEEIARVSAELQALNEEAEQLASAGDSGTDLIPTSKSPTVAKRELGKMTGLIARKQAEIMEKRKELEELLHEQLAETNAVLAPLKKLAARLEEGIWTVNLYLGRDEQIVTLKDGEPAGAEEPLHIRQMVLAMDQECAVAAEEGGIDAISIEAFDEWLLEDPAHLDQVLPEQKGVVALRPRFDSKEYSDPWKASAVSEANKETYFLIRNGDKLYRTYADFQVGSRLIPASDEFTQFFVERRFNFETREYETAQLEPGSSEWVRAEESADRRERHFMRVALILQGLVDRTTVFAPLPAGKVSFLNPADYAEGHVRFIMDAEPSLGSGREGFRDWQKRLNAELRPGMRIIGAFNGEDWRYANDYTDYDGRPVWGKHSRLSPVNSEAPDSNQVYVIEKRRKDGGLVFRFKRHDHIWDARNYEYREPKTKGSCTVYPNDEFVIPFDLANVEEIEAYLKSRTERHNYLTLFPVLKAAIAAKRQEAAEEEPFRKLLIGEIIKANAVSAAAAEAEVDDLISWWKYSNRMHRALLSDDAKALREIVSEHGLRIKDRSRPINDKLVTQIKAKHPSFVLIARKRDGAYIALEAAHEDENVFANYFEYGGRGALKSSEAWKLLQSAHASRWQIIEETERWQNWNWGASLNTHLTGPETEQLVKEMVEDYRSNGHDYFDGDPYKLIAISYDPDKLTFYAHVLRGKTKRHGGVLTGELNKAEVNSYRRSWKREGAQRQAVLGRHQRYSSSNYVWGYKDQYPWEHRGPVLWSDAKAIKAAIAEHDAAEALEQEGAELGSRAGQLFNQIEQAWLEDAEKAAYERFMEDYGEPELWEGHRKTLRIDFPYHRYGSSGLGYLTEYVIENGIDVTNKTVEEVAGLLKRELSDADLKFEIPEDIASYRFSDLEPDDKEPDSNQDEEPETGLVVRD